jgi:microcin C transport system ATP-binding protein
MLSVQNLSISFQNTKVVDNISFNLSPKKITALVGQSGSGKSMTALAIAGLAPKAKISGKIIFEGKNLLEMSEKDLCKIRGKEIGIIFQDPNTSLNPLHKVRKQIAEAIKIHNPKISKKDLQKRIDELLQMTELESIKSRLDHYPHQFSGGQKQRLMIAIALANNPKILIADEPTTALDVTIQNEILKLLLRLKNEMNLAVLFITHNLSIVKKIADEVLEIKEGKLVSTTAKSSEKSFLAVKRDVQETEILSIKNLFVIYDKKFYANRNINFSLKLGENLGIIGESGSGKSTLALALTNLIPSLGEINFFQSKNWQKNNFELRKSIQIIFQDPFSSLNPRMKVEDIILEGLLIHENRSAFAKASADRLTTILNQLHLSSNLKNRYPHELSGGQRQRVAIARALILNPKILVLDEPTSALDFTTQNEILKLLEEIQTEQKISYILISHDLDVVSRIADRIAVLKDGSIVELDEKTKVISNPQSDYTKQLISNFC